MQAKILTRDERQEQARVKWVKSKCKGTFEFPTGFGKTYTAIKCLKSVISNPKYKDFRVLVVVPTDYLKEQWLGHIDENGLSFNVDVQVVNTVIKRDWKVNILVIDEAHRYASETFQEIFNKVKYKYILGLTATFERLDGKHEIIEKYCPIIDKVTLEEALLYGWVAQYREYQVLLDVDDIADYKDYHRAFTEHFEFFNFNFDLAMSMIGKYGRANRAKYRDKLCPPNATEAERKKMFNTISYHATEFSRIMQARKKFIHNHPKKIEMARKIIEARPDAKIITFSNNVRMAEAIGYGVVYTGKSSKKRDSKQQMLDFGLWDSGVINSCAKLNEGADIKGISVAIILGLDSSKTKAVQRRGRVIRKEGEKFAEIFNLVIDQTTDTEWFKKSHEGSDYITIDEEGLNDVLAGREPKPYVKKIKDFTFRY